MRFVLQLLLCSMALSWPAAGPCSAAENAPEGRKAGTNWWSLQPVASPTPPNPSGLPNGWEQPIDRFIFAALAAKGLQPSVEADRRTVIRRVTFDVTGLPPTPEEVGEFLADGSAGTYERLVDRLLASPRYGERFGRLWLDVARFGESNGYERNVLWPNAWPYRDYVIQSLNEDKPFDQFLIEQIAGDAFKPGDRSVEAATAFLVCGPYDDVGNSDPAAAAQIRANHLDDMVRAASEAFLGMTVGCARCHFHKFDPISQEDYHRMQAAFAGVWHGEQVSATAEEKERREAELKKRQAERQAVAGEREAFEKKILERAAGAENSNTPAPELEPPDPYLTEDRFEPVEARAVRLVILANNREPRNAGGVQLDEFEIWTADEPARNVALASAGARAEGETGRVAEDFAGAYGPELTIDGAFSAKWLAAGGARLAVRFARPERIARVTFSSDRQRGLPRENGQNTFVGEYRLEVSPDGTNWLAVADSARRKPVNERFARERTLRKAMTDEDRAELAAMDRRIGEAGRKVGEVPPLRAVWNGNFRPPATNAYLMKGGDPQRRGAEIAPASLDLLPGAGRYELALNAPEAERRLALAKWLAAPENPLTPRVIANRVWQSHFGAGIVETPNDFGWLGGRPSHPELLDWLARRLIGHGWRLKALHREILLSAAYRQSSAVDRPLAGGSAGLPNPLEVDAGNRLLWRFPVRRLAAEEIRDAMLAVSGKLDLKMGGPGFRLYRYLEDNVATYVPLDRHGPETFRRTVYHQNPRAARADLLSEFDCPDNAVSAPARSATTSPMQALTLLNHPFTLDMAEFLAKRLQAEAGEPASQVQKLFALTFGRAPQGMELRAAEAFSAKHGLAALCRAQLNANEFLFIP